MKRLLTGAIVYGCVCLFIPTNDVQALENQGNHAAPAMLMKAAERLNTSLKALDLDMAETAKRMGTLDPTSPVVRELLQRIQAKHPFVVDACFVSPDGIMKIVEPAAYQHCEGSDISQQDQVIELHKTKQPIMSKSFLSVEGFQGVDIEYPILRKSKLQGAVSALIRPDQFIGGIVSPLCQDALENIWVMQNDGIILYDPDPKQIGKNLFDDPLYQPFKELLQLGRSIASQNTGSGHYSFYETGTTKLVTKEAHWTTVSLHGMEWKVVSMKVLEQADGK
jgi:branched-chain amino acid transport system substrate-binding protein